jgi:hypothetical protein
MESLATHQKARLLVALASLNNNHSFGLRACYASVKSSSKPNLVLVRPLRLHSTAWWSSLVANLNSIALRHTFVIGVDAHIMAGHCCVATTTLAHNFIWPYNSFVLSCCTNSLSVSPSLASKPMRRKLNLRSSYLDASTRVSTTQMTT